MTLTHDLDRIVCAGNTFVVFAQVQNGRVQRAWSTGRMMRSLEMILESAEGPDGLPTFIPRACCLCNDAHIAAAVRACEDLFGVEPPRPARLIRSLVQAVRFLQEHLLHVYQYSLSDWACAQRALRADAAKAAAMDSGGRAPAYFQEAQVRLGDMQRRHAGGRSSSLADSESYAGPDELHLLLHAHSFESLRVRKFLNAALESLGGSDSSHPAFQVGGVSDRLGLDSHTLRYVQSLLAQCRDFITGAVLPDLEHTARSYPEWAVRGPSENFLSWGGFLGRDGRDALFPRGVFSLAPEGDRVRGQAADTAGVVEEEHLDWSAEDAAIYRLRLESRGVAFSWGGGVLDWFVSPRHHAQACEVGPLARILGARAVNEELVSTELDACLARIGQPLTAMNSTLGRVLARGVEAAALAEASLRWLDELASELASGRADLRSPLPAPPDGEGVGLVEIPRGALSHTITVESGRITNHTHLIPSLWNFAPGGPEDRSPLESALERTPVEGESPLNLLRTIHAFSPCNACVVVWEDVDKGTVSKTWAQ